MALNNVRANVLKTESTKKQTELIVANVVAFVVFPAIIGLTGAFTSEIYNYDNGLIFVLWVIIILFFGLFWWRCYPAPQSLLKLIYENEEYESMIARSHQDIDSVTDSIRLLAAQAELALSYPSIVVGITDNEISTIEDLSDGISDLCAPFYNQGEFLFGFGGSELWNFAVYLYSAKADKLVPVWRERSRNHPSQGLGRTWERGQGHVGKSFADGKAIITGDALHHDVMQLCWAPPGSEAEYDRLAYRSFASIPIGPFRETEARPYGIFVATSDRIDRFDRENAGILQLAAGAIGSVLALTGAKYDALEKESEVTMEREDDGHH